MTTAQRARELAQSLRFKSDPACRDAAKILEYHAAMLEAELPVSVQELQQHIRDRGDGGMTLAVEQLLDAVRVLTEQRDHFQGQRDDLGKWCLEAQAERDAARAEVERLQTAAPAIRWQDERPTHGKWYVAIAPDRRWAKYGPVEEVEIDELRQVWLAGSLVGIIDHMPGFAGAKWKRREAPADPFASLAADA